MTVTKPFSEQEIDELKTWDLPYVEAPESAEDAHKTNALNKRSDWKYEPPEPEEEEIRPPTAEEIEAIRQAAQDEGYQEGFQKGFEEGTGKGHEEGYQAGLEKGREEGHAEGMASGVEDVNRLASQWQSLVDTLHAPLLQVDNEAKSELVKLAVSLARSVIRTEVQTSQKVILNALEEGMAVLPINEKHYRIAMHPDDIHLVKAHMGEEVLGEKGWQLVENHAMSQGGCDITTSTNAVDVSIERRCRDVLDTFLLDNGLVDD